VLVKMKIRAFCYRCEGWGLCFELISFQGGMREAVRGYGIEEFPFSSPFSFWQSRSRSGLLPECSGILVSGWR